MNWRRWIPMVIVLAGMIAYHNSFMGQFIFDDGDHIHNNPRIRQLWPPWEALGGTARPLVQWSLAVNFATGELNPFDYHLFNLSVHLLAGLTLYGVLRRTLGRIAKDHRPQTTDYRLNNGGTCSVTSFADVDTGVPLQRVSRLNDRMDNEPVATGTVALQNAEKLRPRGTVALQDQFCGQQSSVRNHGREAVLAGIIALIWVVHPLNTQAVTYIIQRGESMMGLFYLLTLYCFIRGVEVSEALAADSCGSSRTVSGLQSTVYSPQRSHMLWLAASVLACTAGMLCKEVMFTAPLMVLLYDWFFVEQSSKSILRSRFWFYAALFATCAIPVVLSMQNLTEEASAGFGMKAVSPLQYALAQPGVILQYLRLAVWPVGLCFDYLWPVAQGFWQIAPPVCAVAGMLLLTLYLFYRSNALAFLGIWFFGILSVTSSIMPIADLAVEHRMYLPTAAVITLVVVGAHQLSINLREKVWLSSGALRCALVGVVFVITLGLIFGTMRRNADYHDPIGMWNKVIGQRVWQPRAFNQIGQILSLGMNKHREAIPYFETVVAMAPGVATGYESLGGAWSHLGDHQKALHYYQEAARIEPGDASTLTKIGVQNAALRRWDVAEELYQRALVMDPENALAHNNLGVAYNQRKEIYKALEHFQRAVDLAPLDAVYRLDLADTLRALNRHDEAIEQYMQMLKFEPNNENARVNCGLSMIAVGKTKQALEQFMAAMNQNPSRLDLYISSAWIMATDPDPAVRDGTRASKLAQKACEFTEYKQAGPLDVLAAAHAESGSFTDAIATAEKAGSLAQQAGNAKLADEINQRIALYRIGKPFRLQANPDQVSATQSAK